MMDIINLTVTYIQDFAAKSEATYHINPWIFCILFFGSALPLYYGYYQIGKSTLKIEDRKIELKKIDKRGLKTGIIVSSVAWCIPYLYVILFGKLPLHIWMIFIVFVIVMGYIFIKTLKNRIKSNKS